MPEEKSGKMPFALMVGDEAPGLMVSKWIQGDPIAIFKSGHVYVVDFWATWCRPCVASIPHVAELSKKYKGKATVIGMNIWQPDPAEVKPFVDKMGEKMPYAIATDIVTQGADANTGKMAVGWMNAAGQRGIPAVFLIGLAAVGGQLFAEKRLPDPECNYAAHRLDDGPVGYGGGRPGERRLSVGLPKWSGGRQF